jgi:DNA polymerase-3 subunit epsilon
MRHFAIDTETTDLKNAHPIEIAAVCVDDFSIVFCERIRPSIDIDPKAQAVHGISLESLSQCRSESEVMNDFVLFLTTNNAKTLVAHNAAFDKNVIHGALQRSHLQIPEFEWECTLEMSRRKMPKLKHKLSDCCLRLGIDYKDAHCALPDAIMCARVFKSFYEPKIEDMWMDAGLIAVNEAEKESDEDQYNSMGFI